MGLITIFFYGKGKGKRAFGSPDSKWSPPPTTVCNTRGAIGVLPAFKVEIDVLLEGPIPMSYRPGNTAACRPFHNSGGAWKEVIRRNYYFYFTDLAKRNATLSSATKYVMCWLCEKINLVTAFRGNIVELLFL